MSFSDEEFNPEWKVRRIIRNVALFYRVASDYVVLFSSDSSLCQYLCHMNVTYVPFFFLNLVQKISRSAANSSGPPTRPTFQPGNTFVCFFCFFFNASSNMSVFWEINEIISKSIDSLVN